MARPTKNWLRLFLKFLALIKWEELFHGLLMLWMGWQYTKNFGYKTPIRFLIPVGLWFINFKTASLLLSEITSEAILKIFYEEPYWQTINSRFRSSLISLFWIIAALFLMLSLLPLYQIYIQFDLELLSIVFFSVFILADLAITYNEKNLRIPGIEEIATAFLQSLVLPTILIVLITGHLHFSLLNIAYPFYLINIALRINNHLELKNYGKKIAPSTIMFHLSIHEASLLIVLLIISSAIIPTLQVKPGKIFLQGAIIALSLFTSFFILKRSKKPKLFCPWCKLLLLMQYLLSICSALFLL